MNEVLCPRCQRQGAVKNGHLASSGKQNWLCWACGRQFVANPRGHSMNEAEEGVERASRLVRKALSFSKKLDNRIAAIKLFVCDYNATLNAVPCGHA